MALETIEKNMFTLLYVSDHETDHETDRETDHGPAEETCNRPTEETCNRPAEGTCNRPAEEIKIDDLHLRSELNHIKIEDNKDSGIIPFKGVECRPLKSLKNIHSPKKAPVMTQKGLKKHNIISRFTVSTGYTQKFPEHQQSEHCDSHNNPLTTTIFNMGDKEAISKRLLYTRACNNVLQKDDNGEYGVCYRDVCTFAHSLQELNDPMCVFDMNCNFRYGRSKWDGTFDPSGKCMFRHRDESREGWLNRTGRTLPALPDTSEKTRNPPSSREEGKALGSGYDTKSNLTRPATKITLNTPLVSQKISSTVKKLEFPDSNKSLIIRSSNDSERRHRISPPAPNTSVIKVPTEELAKIAIQAAFDHGVYNFRIMIE